MSNTNTVQTATLAGGCFWCTEAIFKRLNGVTSVKSGYTGGTIENPTYEDVSAEATGHAEAIQVTFDPAVISYETLLAVFFATHDPTEMNRQGNDVGAQYRSSIFYHSDEQKEKALAAIEQLEKEGKYHDPIVTKLEAFTTFYPAEDYHADYYDSNRSAPYCMAVIDPKIRKLMENFKDTVKEEYRE